MNSTRAAKRQKTACSLMQVLETIDVTLAEVKACIKQGGSIYEKTTEMPMHRASSISVWTGDTSILKYLISITPVRSRSKARRLKALVNAKDRYGRTPLHYAATSNGPRGSGNTIKLLVEAGADINAGDNYGNTPMHRATTFDIPATVKVLIGLGADINIPRSCDWSTPLHEAALRSNLVIVKILLAAGANWQALDDNGKTPYDIARLETRNYLKMWRERYWMTAAGILHRALPTNLARSLMQQVRN